MHSIMQPSSHMSLACPLRRNGFVSHVAPSFPRLRSRPTCAAACGAIRLRLHDVQLLNTVCRRPRRAALFLTKCVLADACSEPAFKARQKFFQASAYTGIGLWLRICTNADSRPSSERYAPKPHISWMFAVFRLQPTLPLLFILMICTPFPCRALPDGSPKEAFN